ncbi:uncharacterized protein EI97DRAFT_403486 [Westerdykella ornata]
MTSHHNVQALQDEIDDLERRLKDAKLRLQASNAEVEPRDCHVYPPPSAPSQSTLHALLLLSDSALPLGSFAFSSGLESYLAHHKHSHSFPQQQSSSQKTQLAAFHTFLKLSLATLASTSLSYVLAGYRNPGDVESLDNEFDASTPCIVARRASVAQGRALVAVWERSFRDEYCPAAQDEERNEAIDALKSFSASLRSSASIPPTSTANPFSTHLNAHLAPLWGLVTRAFDIPLRDAAYLFLFAHARTVMSAAVRASVMGPYQAQAVLASGELRERICGLVREGWGRGTEEAGQGVPVMDVWVGRHEVLYSRIFNS